MECFSSWQEFELQERIATTTLIESVQRYLYELNKELRMIEYPVTLDQYLRGERMMRSLTNDRVIAKQIRRR